AGAAASCLSALSARGGSLAWGGRHRPGGSKFPRLTLPIYASYFPKWEPKRPSDFDEHMARLRANLREPSRRKVIRAYMLEQSHREAELRLGKVNGPSLGVMGTGDVDWPHPVDEAHWRAE